MWRTVRSYSHAVNPTVRLAGGRFVVVPGERRWSFLRSLLSESGVAGNLTTDAHLAAIAIGHGAELESADGDFARFRGLRWSNPLMT